MGAIRRLNWVVLLGWLLVWHTPRVTAATPVKVVLSGPGLASPVEIATAKDIIALETGLCPDQVAGALASRAFLNIEIQWLEDPEAMTWRGKFYPAVHDQPAAVDIPDWRLYSGDGKAHTCEGRIVGAEALQVLARYGVPVEIGAPGSLPQAGAGPQFEWLVFGMITAGWLFFSVGLKIRERRVR